MSNSNQLLLTRKKLDKPKTYLKQKPLGHSYWCVTLKKKNGIEKLLSNFKHNVVPSACIDSLSNLGFVNTSNTGTRGFGCIAVTSDTGQTINAAQTALTSEITANGFARADATTKTHTNGTNSTLIEHTFTASGQQASITRAALFNVATAPVSGTMGPFNAFSTATGQIEIGETLKVSVTVNIS